MTFGANAAFRVQDYLYDNLANDGLLPYSDVELIVIDSKNQVDSHKGMLGRYGTPIPDEFSGPLSTPDAMLTDKTIHLNKETLRAIWKETAKVFHFNSYHNYLRNCNSLRVSLWYIFTGEWNTRL